MMLDETGNGKTVIFVVSCMKGPGIRGRERKVSDEVGVDELLHQLLNAEATRIETVVYVEEEDRTTVLGRGC